MTDVLNKIPKDNLDDIMSFLSPGDIAKFSATSKGNNEYANITILNPSDSLKYLNDDEFSKTIIEPKILHINIEIYFLIISESPRLKNITSMNLYLHSNDKLVKLPELTNLTSLKIIRYEDFSLKLNTDFIPFNNFKNLTSLDLSNSGIESFNVLFVKIKNLNKLKKINLSENDSMGSLNIPDDSKWFESLKELNLNFTRIDDDENLSDIITKLKNLEHLHLKTCRFSILSLTKLNQNLISLSLPYIIDEYDDKVLIDKIKSLKKIKNLSLDLFSNSFKEPVIKKIIKDMDLTYLDLSHAQHLDAQQFQSISEEFKKMKNLESINLNECGMYGNTMITILSNLNTNIKYLGIRNNKLFDKENPTFFERTIFKNKIIKKLTEQLGEALLKFKDLRYLDLRYCCCPDEENLIESIKKMSNLEELNIWGTVENIKNILVLKKSLKKLRYVDIESKQKIFYHDYFDGKKIYNNSIRKIKRNNSIRKIKRNNSIRKIKRNNSITTHKK